MLEIVATNPDATESLDGQVYSFECRMAGRQLSRGEPTVYERVSVSGTFRGPRRRRDWSDKYLKGIFLNIDIFQECCHSLFIPLKNKPTTILFQYPTLFDCIVVLQVAIDQW